MTSGVGRLLGGRYTLITPIAQGGMGEVWKARDRVSGQIVAAKVLRPELSGEALSLSRLRLEARNSMSVQHPNIANVQDSGEDDGRGWIIMELVEGRPLTDYLKGGSRIEPRYLVPLLIQVAMALGAAAGAGVVHRDIKPANILVRGDGMVKLTDFGISRASNQVSLTADGMVMGTAQYLPPEQAMGETATSAGDLYALGVIAYEAAAGRRPFTGDTQVDIAFSHVNDAVPPLPADVPQPLADAILHLLEKDPAKRPESGTAAVREFNAVAKQLRLPVLPQPLPLPEGVAPTPSPTADQPVVSSKGQSSDSPQPPVASSESGTGSGAASTQEPGAASTPAPDNAVAESPRAALARRLRERQAAREAADREAVAKEAEARQAAAKAAAESEARSARQVAAARQAAAQGEAAVRTNIEAPTATKSPTRASASPTSTARARTTQGITRAARPRWTPVSEAPTQRRSPSRPPATTKYNRSQVAPAAPKYQQALIWMIALVIVAVVIGLTVLMIANFSGSLGTSARGIPTTEEVWTWQSPWPAV
ncbi:serine/threonine-protein kinase [Schaalia vaccimaxillae]|uniref:serine/threonine-protein kinase n=1 Tax=Schaalia vaccimaxillae TaxID=183916 RepID=UPI00058C7F85|nr:serine/threonine-protein kinase [Schaalia vaccimaxillae]